MTYEQRRRELAEKMAKNEYERCNSDDDWEDMKVAKPTKALSLVSDMLPLADIALAEMAEMYEQGYRQGYFDLSERVEAKQTPTLQQHIHSLGLTEKI